MAWLYILGTILLIVITLLIIPVRILISFRTDLAVKLKWTFININLYPAEEKEEKTKPAAKQQVKKQEVKKKKEKKALKAKDIFEYIDIIKRLMPELRAMLGFITRHITIDKLNLKIIVSGDDAAETGILFGKLGAAVYSALAVVQNIFKVKPPQSISLNPDFVNIQNDIDFSARVSLPVWAALLPAIRLGIKAFRELTDLKHTKPKEAPKTWDNQISEH